MRIGASLFIIAVGAMLRFAVEASHQSTHGFNLRTAGVILMVIGAVGILITAVLLSTRRPRNIITRTPTGTRRTSYVESTRAPDLTDIRRRQQLAAITAVRPR